MSEKHIVTLDLNNDSDFDLEVELHTACAVHSSSEENDDYRSILIAAGERYSNSWTLACYKYTETAGSFSYKFISTSGVKMPTYFGFEYEPYLEESLRAGDVIAIKGVSDTIHEVTLESEHFSRSLPRRRGLSLEERIRVKNSKIIILGNSDSDTYFLGFPDRTLSDFVRPVEGSVEVEGLTLQPLSVVDTTPATQDDPIVGDNVRLQCDNTGCSQTLSN